MFIGADHTAYGTPYQPLSVGDLKYRSEMKIDIKNVLWDNVSALMDSRYKKENLTQMAKDSGVGNGTMTRIKNQETSVGIDTLEKLAVIAKVKPWQLIQPNMGAGLESVKTDSTSGDWPFEDVDIERWNRLSERQKGVIEKAMNDALDQLEMGQHQANRTGT